MTPLPASRTLVIAEAGINHNGSLGLARELVEAARSAGADVVKFQTFKATRVVSRFADKAAYQKLRTDANESQLEMVKRWELDATAHQDLVAHSRAVGIEFLSSPFDVESVDFLVRDLGCRRLKIPSGEITNGPLLLAAGRARVPLILSTGMSELGEVRAALELLAFGMCEDGAPSAERVASVVDSSQGQEALARLVTLLHCTTEYPAPLSDVHLRAMATLRETFGLPVGYSDHTVGGVVPIGAVALGAVVIEKHLTLNRTLPGPDQQGSLEPDEFRDMVEDIRAIEAALGDAGKRMTESEAKNLPIARKSLVAARPIRRGERFSESNITAKRPGGGIDPMQYWNWLGKMADRDFDEDEAIS
jgi:N-acetylneuraminate synthase